MSSENPTRLAVIGGGPGGYVAAFLAADLGMDVTLIDPKENPGGVCLYKGCIPSKALLHIAKLLNETEEAKKWGINFGEPRIDIDKVREWKNSVVEKLTGGLGRLVKQRKINHIKSRAIFKDAHTLKVADCGGTSELTFDYIIIATGSRPAMVPGISLDSPRLISSTGALALENVPKSLLVVGGGYIGLEMGTVYAALGSEVTVVEMLPNLLPGADQDLVRILERNLKKKFKAILTGTKVVGMAEVGDGIKVTFEGPKVKEPEQVFEKVLVSIGRKPNSEAIGLENTRVELDKSGFITVDGQRRTAEPGVYAIGDVAGQPMLAHKASAEGKVAVETIAGHKVAFEPRAIPAVVFTDPEIAWCGLTETEAKAQGIDYAVMRFPWAASGRALAMDRTDGSTKLLVDPQTERVLGMAVCGAGAGELIAEGVLAIEMAAV
ncbi:dihydrolipoyl dehydrogenase, partial [bacterium]|nr:dihydrolipoyl dehydrogenase [bacterium]